jgi:D-alanyl-lipoteichoic acid acyltransferase DltB (MBOAT superfamily)
MAYWATPKSLRIWMLLVASVLFYASWHVGYLALLLGVVGVAWRGALGLAHRRAEGRDILGAQAAVVGLLLVPLIVFKYWNWLSGDWVDALHRLGLQADLPAVHLALPVGISFFTFQAIAYVVDAGRSGQAEPRLVNVAGFVTFFPQLIAGPIVRGHELLPQLRDPPLLRSGQIGEGLFRIAKGIAKKLLLADLLRVGMVDPLFSDPGRFTGPELWVGLYAYTMQIYYDFSAYTDIAIGSALLFGLRLPENFDRPYVAPTITDFWRRWHKTLGLWVRHYIYFPLGGARGAPSRVYVNLGLTFLVLGIWHGADWTFVIYGAIHGGAMCLQRALRKRHGRDPGATPSGWWARFWRVFATFHFVVLARILFRAPTLAGALAYASGLWDPTFVMPRFSHLSWGLLLAAFAIHFSPILWVQRAQDWFLARRPITQAGLLAGVGVACMTLGTGEQLAFVYYQF